MHLDPCRPARWRRSYPTSGFLLRPLRSLRPLLARPRPRARNQRETAHACLRPGASSWFERSNEEAMSDRRELPLDADPGLVMHVMASAPGPGAELFSLAALGSVPLRHLRLMIVTPLVITALLVGVGVLLARYTAESQFTPATSSPNLAGIAGVAAQLGIN